MDAVARAPTLLPLAVEPRPALFPAAPKSARAPPAAADADACFPECMDPADDAPAPAPQRETRTLELEELGLAAAAPPARAERSIVVDYEDSDGEHPAPRAAAATATACAPGACGPLTGAAGLEVVAGGLRGKRVLLEQAAEPAAPDAAPTRCSKVHKLCLCELQLHKSLESCWLVCGSHVYDVTGLVTAHPGGVRSILRKAGGPDCTRDMKFHTKNARKMMEKCFIGKLQPCGDDADGAGDANCSIM